MASQRDRDYRDDRHRLRRPGAGVKGRTRQDWRLPVPVGRIAGRFAEVVCPPQVRTEGRADRVVGEFELMLAAMQPFARHTVSVAFIVFDRMARLFPVARGRRFVRLEHQAAERYVRTLMARSAGLGGVTRRLKGVIVMCYYELPEVKEEIGYRPDPYISAVSQRRLARYGAQIRMGEAAVLAETKEGR